MAHVSLVTLGVDDLTRATGFYESLGWRRSSASVEGVVAFLKGGTVVLGLFGRTDLAADAHVDADAPGTHGNVALAMNLESESAVDDVLGTAADAGGHITKVGQRTEWGGYSGYFRDPEGHLWEVAHNPHFRLTDDGQVVLPVAD
ncbi:MAG TPA: VOC family protein [Nitriliruptorales bacterium]